MTTAARNLKQSLCSLFEVYADENGVRRVVLPIEYPGTSDNVVVRVRPQPDGSYRINENGEAALHASMADGDTESESVKRWIEDLNKCGTVSMDENEILFVTGESEQSIAHSIFRAAEAAQRSNSMQPRPRELTAMRATLKTGSAKQ